MSGGKTDADKLEGLWEFYGHMDRRWEADPCAPVDYYDQDACLTFPEALRLCCYAADYDPGGLCPHVQLSPEGDRYAVDSTYVSPPGTEAWQCQMCGHVTHDEASIERGAQNWARNPQAWIERRKKIKKLAEKLGRTGPRPDRNTNEKRKRCDERRQTSGSGADR